MLANLGFKQMKYRYSTSFSTRCYFDFAHFSNPSKNAVRQKPQAKESLLCKETLNNVSYKENELKIHFTVRQ